jgi:misacylated tRNA(Ala) deacylase
MMTELLFRADAYRQECRASVVGCEGAVVRLDRTVFYPMGGGQPGDKGVLRTADGTSFPVLDTRKGEDGEAALHLIQGDLGPPVGMEVTALIDWDRRYRLMRTHSALHLLCRAIDGAVTGGQVGELRGRLDFDLPDASLDRQAVEAQLAQWIEDDRAIRDLWIDEADLGRRPDLVRTMSVRPPSGAGRIRLVEIDGVDLQACGGTHVSRTAEIGPVAITKVEKKGRQNRRVVIELG